MRTLVIVILVTALVTGAYFIGLHRTAAINDPEGDRSRGGLLDDYYEYQGQHWTDSYYQNEGPVCFNAMEDGSTRILVTPSTVGHPPSCMRDRRSSAGFVIDQNEYQINVHSQFALSTSFVCVTADAGYYPRISENFGPLESGEYEVHHGAIRLGTIQLPATAVPPDQFGTCLQPSTSNPTED